MFLFLIMEKSSIVLQHFLWFNGFPTQQFINLTSYPQKVKISILKLIFLWPSIAVSQKSHNIEKNTKISQFLRQIKSNKALMIAA